MTAPDISMPIAPEVTPDPLLDTIPGAVVESRESPAVMRIGVVAQIIEGSQITVKISGSDILVDCSYLFFQYFPLLGDRVILLRQDSQWVCIGEMSGAIGSNTPLPNSSFESGVIGAMPDDWSITIIASPAGVPSFLVASPSSVNISGKQVADFGVDSVVAGISIADVYSSTVPATPDSAWTGAYYLTRAFVNTSPPMFSELEMWIQFLDGGGALISESLINVISLAADSLAPVYRRLNLTSFPSGYVTAPAGTVSTRVRFRGTFELPATSFVSFFIDNVILRQVD
jgi:hypothetical protein